MCCKILENTEKVVVMHKPYIKQVFLINIRHRILELSKGLPRISIIFIKSNSNFKTMFQTKWATTFDIICHRHLISPYGKYLNMFLRTFFEDVPLSSFSFQKSKKNANDWLPPLGWRNLITFNEMSKEIHKISNRRFRLIMLNTNFLTL